MLDRLVVYILSSSTHMFAWERQLIHLSGSSACIDLFTLVTHFKRSTRSPYFRDDSVFDQSVVCIISSSAHTFFWNVLIHFSDLFISIGSFGLVTQLKVSTHSPKWDFYTNDPRLWEAPGKGKKLTEVPRTPHPTPHPLSTSSLSSEAMIINLTLLKN